MSVRTVRRTGPLRHAAAVVLLAHCLSGAAAEGTPASEQVFARVGDTVVSVQEFVLSLRDAVRSKYYHAEVPVAERPVFEREVGEKLINRVLLLQEAKRQNIAPDDAWIKPRLESMIQRYSTTPDWEKEKDRLTRDMRQRLENESRLQILEARVRDVPAPSEAQLRAYYDAHPETFTEPEQTKVSIILLKVDPSSSAEVWDAARKEAAALHERLKKGADFAELARMHSGDASAAQGGDMGYIHRGMLGELAQKAIDALKPGQNTAPVELLEGIALFRLVERQKPNLNDLATVKARAHDLWRRDEGERAWKGLIAKLRRETPIELHEELYTPLPAAGQGAASGAKQERSGRHP